MTDEVKKLKELIDGTDNIVFFGGAGVSTESGIPDFRSVDGLYHQQWDDPPETILSHTYYERYPEKFFAFYRAKLLCEGAKPNAAHLKLAEWEKEGKLKAVITQNIDGLHQAAGSKNVLELHGSTLRNYCEKCGKAFTNKDFGNSTYKIENALEHVYGEFHIEKAPTCTKSGTGYAVCKLCGDAAYFEGEKAATELLKLSDFDGNATAYANRVRAVYEMSEPTNPKHSNTKLLVAVTKETTAKDINGNEITLYPAKKAQHVAAVGEKAYKLNPETGLYVIDANSANFIEGYDGDMICPDCGVGVKTGKPITHKFTVDTSESKLATFDKTTLKGVDGKADVVKCDTCNYKGGETIRAMGMYDTWYGEDANQTLRPKEMLPLPSEEDERRMYARTREILEQYGYHRYEISNYAKDGYACRHNIGYWNRTDYLGIGLGASSLIDPMRWKMTSDLSDYLECGKNQGDFANLREEVQTLRVSERMEEFMFLGLRLTKGIELQTFERQFGKSFWDVYQNAADKLFSEQLLCLDESKKNLRLTDYGVDVSNYALAEFLLDY